MTTTLATATTDAVPWLLLCTSNPASLSTSTSTAGITWTTMTTNAIAMKRTISVAITIRITSTIGRLLFSLFLNVAMIGSFWTPYKLACKKEGSGGRKQRATRRSGVHRLAAIASMNYKNEFGNLSP